MFFTLGQMSYFAYERRGEKALLLLGTAPSRRYPSRYIERGHINCCDKEQTMFSGAAKP